MTYKEKVEYLNSYRDKHFRLIYIENQLLGIKGISYEELFSNAKKSQLDYIEEKTILEKEMAEIKQCIESIRDIKSRYVLMYKFIEFKSLEEIAEIMNYSLSWVKIYYKKGIKIVPK